MNHQYTKILHVSIGTITDTWNCEKYRNQIEEILGTEYYLSFTSSAVGVSHPKYPVTKIEIASDSNINMKKLIDKITKMKEDGDL